MQKLINIHLVTGGYIMKEKIAVIPTGITKRSWKGMIMAGTKPKNINGKYSKGSLEKVSNNGRRKVRITSILRK
jgi:hypothetical protein